MATKTSLANGNGTLQQTHSVDNQVRQTTVLPKRRKVQQKKKIEDEGLMATLCTLICDHQIGTIPLCSV